MGALASAPIAVLCLLLEEYLRYLPAVDMTLLTAMRPFAGSVAKRFGQDSSEILICLSFLPLNFNRTLFLQPLAR